MERFLNPLGFISCIHLVTSPKEVFGKGKKNLRKRTESITFKGTNQTCCCKVQKHIVRAWGLWLRRRATLDVRHRPAGSHDALQPFTKLLPEPLRRKRATYFPVRIVSVAFLYRPLMWRWRPAGVKFNLSQLLDWQCVCFFYDWTCWKLILPGDVGFKTDEWGVWIEKPDCLAPAARVWWGRRGARSPETFRQIGRPACRRRTISLRVTVPLSSLLWVREINDTFCTARLRAALAKRHIIISPLLRGRTGTN